MFDPVVGSKPGGLKMNDLITIARANTDLISIVGALIIFFSWVVNNTLKTNYSNLKNAIASAERDTRLYGALDELAGSVNAIASEVVEPKLRERQERYRDANTIQSLFLATADKLSTALLAAYQIRACEQFCARSLMLSNAHSGKTASARALDAVAKESSALFAEFSIKRGKCEDIINQIRRQGDDVKKDEYQVAMRSIDDFIQYIREFAIPKVGPFYERAVPATNERRAELRKVEAQMGKYVRTFDRLSIWLYIVGSVLTLLGKVIEKMATTV